MAHFLEITACANCPNANFRNIDSEHTELSCNAIDNSSYTTDKPHNFRRIVFNCPLPTEYNIKENLENS